MHVNDWKKGRAYARRMPRFYFHIQNGDEVTDHEGVELRDWEAAVDHANRAARAMMAEELRQTGRIALHHRVEVADCDGPVATVRFGDAVEIER